MMNLDVYHSSILGGINKQYRLDDRDWGADYFHVAAAFEVEAAGGDHGIDEDDIVYAELSRQVLLLTADDDHEDIEEEEEEEEEEEAAGHGHGLLRFDYVNGYGNLVMNMMKNSKDEGYNYGTAVADFTGISHHPYFNLWESSSDQYYGNIAGVGGGASWEGSSSWASPVNTTGTGVFIPHVANSKRRHRRGKKNGKKRAAGESKP